MADNLRIYARSWTAEFKLCDDIKSERANWLEEIDKTLTGTVKRLYPASGPFRWRALATENAEWPPPYSISGRLCLRSITAMMTSLRATMS